MVFCKKPSLFKMTHLVGNWSIFILFCIWTFRFTPYTAVQQFDYSTIVDVILHIKYTAREGGSSLKTLAQAALKDQLAAISTTNQSNRFACCYQSQKRHAK